MSAGESSLSPSSALQQRGRPSRWPSIDPTRPDRWETVRRIGKLAFVTRVGIIGIGVPLALVFHVLVLLVRGETALLMSADDALELAFTLTLVAPVAGALAGQTLWARGERRMGDYFGHTDAAAIAPSPAVQIDGQQRRLSVLRTRLESLARTAPERLIAEVIAMTVLGYVYVVAVVALLVGGVVWLLHEHGRFGGLAGRGAWMLAWFAYFVLSALRVRLVAPSGRRVTRAGSPALFRLLDEIQRELDAPAPDVVLIDEQLNAHVSEIPKYGIVGLPKRYLVIGMLLLESLPLDECRAILAHELAHLSRRHVRRLSWVLRVSVTWQNLATTLEAGRHWGRLLFLPFSRWYAPRLELYAQTGARIDEHESDALAAKCAGPTVVATSLLRVHAMQRFLSERVVPSILRRSADRSDPPDGGYLEIVSAVRRGPAEDDLARWVRISLGERTLDAHSHPSLADRVAALGLEFDGAEAGAAVAADLLGTGQAGLSGAELLGANRVPKLLTQVESEWQRGMLPLWRRLHADASVWRGNGDGTEPDGRAVWARARWASDCEPRDGALPLVREVLRGEPSHLEAAVLLGRLLAQSDVADERVEGVAMLESTMRRDSVIALLACAALEAHYVQNGSRPDVDRVQTRERQLRQARVRGIAERTRLRAGDAIACYQLPSSLLAPLDRMCTARREITSVYLVRKSTKFLREQPCVMLAVECDVPWYKPSTGAAAVEACRALLDRVTLPEFGDLVAIAVEPRSRLQRRLRAIRGAQVYRRHVPT